MFALLMLLQLRPARAFQRPHAMTDLQEQSFGSTPGDEVVHGREVGPAWEMQKTRALATTSLGMQRAVGDQNVAWTIRVPRSWAKIDTHIQTSGNLQSPYLHFSQRAPMDPDLEFAMDALVFCWTWNSIMASRAGKFLNAARETWTPLREATQPLRSFTAQTGPAHAMLQGNPLFTALLRWPESDPSFRLSCRFQTCRGGPSFRSVSPDSLVRSR